MKIEFFKKPALGTAIAVLCLLGVPAPINSPAQTPPGNAMATGELPSYIYPTSPLAQVIRLSQAGVDESIILTYITNSSSTFNLDSDKIIYLKDIGLPNEVVTAMMQRDQQLQQQMAATAYQPPAPPAPATDTNPETEPAPPPPEEQPAPPPTEVTINYFYDTLAPYGSWVNVDGYGQCWRPSVMIYNPGWQPYCDHGHWVYTDCGWYWYSDYSWGWAPFHYGRWFQHPHWGWCWTPDTVWGPSWVTWRYSDGYCGWAPLPPFAAYQAGIGFFYRGSAVGLGFNWGLSAGCFTFVPTQFFCDPHPRRHRVDPGQRGQIFDRTTVINNFNGHDHNLANRGIDPEHITAVTHTPIRPVTIQNTTASSGYGPRGDQLSHDGSTLIISRPSRTGLTTQSHSPQPYNNQSVLPARSVHQPQVPVVTTRGPQENNAIRVPAQRPSLPANDYYSSPTPNYDNRTISPRGREQTSSSRNNPRNSDAPVVIPPSNEGQSGASEAGRHSAPAAAPAQTQHNQPSSSPLPSSRSSGQNQDQGGSGSGSGRGQGH